MDHVSSPVTVRVVSEKCSQIVKSSVFEACISTIIVLNCFVLAINDPTSTVQDKGFGGMLEVVFFIFYLIEMVIKVVAAGFVFNRGAYLRDPWNVMDFIIILASVLIMAQSAQSQSGSTSINLSSLRTIRILRPLRTINTVKKLKTLVQTVLTSIPFLLDMLAIIIFTISIFAIAGMQLFRGGFQYQCFEAATGRRGPFDADQICGGIRECPTGYLCGKIGKNPATGIYSLDNFADAYLFVFMVLSTEGWSTACAYLMYSTSTWSLVFFISIILLETWFLFNLALAIISAKFNEAQESVAADIKVEIRNPSSSL